MFFILKVWDLFDLCNKLFFMKVYLKMLLIGMFYGGLNNRLEFCVMRDGYLLLGYKWNGVGNRNNLVEIFNKRKKMKLWICGFFLRMIVFLVYIFEFFFGKISLVFVDIGIRIIWCVEIWLVIKVYNRFLVDKWFWVCYFYFKYMF